MWIYTPSSRMRGKLTKKTCFRCMTWVLFELTVTLTCIVKIFITATSSDFTWKKSPVTDDGLFSDIQTHNNHIMLLFWMILQWIMLQFCVAYNTCNTRVLWCLKTQWFIELITLFTSAVLFKFHVSGRKCTSVDSTAV